ncbi:Protein of uncharacterised function (DUF3742) [Pseudomonas fluorescens]|jgi:hypothetical protein|uniref:Protein of uncharacterized function (DUF3742) n=1 Tax=Pseudomonas fluorescens TaxID=294 RepID=A0A379IF38_PSEFL|nr:Protein of uncharacterised function (DUF3742) [Pseudomonas fluorescens]
MVTHTHNERWTYRFGQGMGRAWRAYVRRERQAVGWLDAHGVPVSIAKMLLWLVKLVLFGILLYVAFWLTLLLILAIAGAWAIRNTDTRGNDEEPEWRIGLSGYGLYRGDVRIDPGTPDDDY